MKHDLAQVNEAEPQDGSCEESFGSVQHLTDKRPHILFVIDQLCEAGGAERMLLNIVRRLPRDKFRCSLATFKLDSRVPLFSKMPCPVHVFPLRRTYNWNAIKMAFQLRKLIRSQGVVVVHTFFETSDLWSSVVAKMSGCPILISSRRDMGILRSAKHQLAYRLINSLFDRVLTVSEEVRSFCIEREGLEPGKVVTLYNGLELEQVSASNGMESLRDSLGLQRASHLVTTVAHVRRVKGLDTLIQAGEMIRRELPCAHFLIVGNPSEPEHFQELQRLAQRLGLAGNIHFLGGSEQVFSLLKMSDVFCLPSRSEGFSNALLEAMACGLPCVATRVGGNSEAIEDARSGFLVQPEDPRALADRILWLLKHPDESKLMGRAGARIAESKFTAKVMMDQLVQVYDNLLN